MNHLLKPLVGKTVRRILMLKESEILIFETDESRIAFTVDADCCSHSYFYEILGPQNILGKEVTEAYEIPMHDEELGLSNREKREEQESIVAYGFKVRAGDDFCDVIFRNSSNGYYGGSLAPAHVQKAPPEEKILIITEDWMED